MRKYIWKTGKMISICFILAIACAFIPAGKVHAEPVKIVIDPGHGGTNLGAQYNGFTEKYMTMVVANAMAEELKKYEGIEVYMTRTEDVELSLQQRADYAKSVDADFFFCLHFNMSENHTFRRSGSRLSGTVTRRERVSGSFVWMKWIRWNFTAEA